MCIGGKKLHNLNYSVTFLMQSRLLAVLSVYSWHAKKDNLCMNHVLLDLEWLDHVL